MWSSLARASGGAMSDTTLSSLAYLQAILTLAAGILMIANLRFGGLLLFLGMVMTIATRDNPLLTVTESAFHNNL